ncbi:hypothetical protein PQX77_014074 [Marasmius sp. AFHP31]|nr:hypothetical protein PQX77_014074 [Marasmius sp. AFHP31]
MVSNVKNGYIATDLKSNPRQDNKLEKDYSLKYTSAVDGYSLARVVRSCSKVKLGRKYTELAFPYLEGILYFTFMLVLNFVNIGLVANGANPLLQGGSQLQMVFHSVLSTRVVLHLANSRTPKEVSTPGSSVVVSDMRFPHGARRHSRRSDGTTSDWRAAADSRDTAGTSAVA